MPIPEKLKVWLDALVFAWRQPSFRVWIAICTVGIVIGLMVGIGMTSLVLLVAIACIGWGMEVANTAIESLLDIVHPEYSEKVKVVKDAFASVPIFVFSAYVVSWLILVAPSLVRWFMNL
jgi:undecaprenol kinase